MDENAKNTVVSLTSHKANSQSRIEVDGVRRCISILSWDLQVRQFLGLSGLSLSESLLSPNVTPLASSTAAKLGHLTLESLICKPESEDGLGQDWNKFQAMMKGLIYREKFAISESSYEEINALVDDAFSIMGRMPSDAAEFHGAKQEALEAQINQITRESQSRLEDVQGKNKDLVRDLAQERATLKKEREAHQAALAEGAGQIQRMTREMAIKLESYEAESSVKINEARAQIEEDFTQRMVEAKGGMMALVAQAEEDRLEAQKALSNLTGRIESGDLVEASKLNELNLKLKEASETESALRNQMLSINEMLTQSNKKADQIQTESDQRQEIIQNLQDHAGTLEQRMRELIEDRMGASEFAVLNERLTMRQQELEATSELLKETAEQRDRAKNDLAIIRGRFAQLKQLGKEQISSLRDQVRSGHQEILVHTNAIAGLKATSNQLKIVVFGLTAVSALLAVCLAAVAGMF